MGYSPLPPQPHTSAGFTAHTEGTVLVSGVYASAVGDLLLAVVYVDTLASAPGFSVTGSSGPWELAGQAVATAHGSMAVFTRVATAADLSGGGSTYSFTGPHGPQMYQGGSVGPSSISVHVYAFSASPSGPAGLGGPVLFTGGVGKTATTAAATVPTAAPATLQLLSFASTAGESFTAPSGATAGASTGFFAQIRMDGFHLVPGPGTVPAASSGLSSIYSVDTAWMTCSVLVLPSGIPDPPSDTDAGYGDGIHFSPGAFQPTPVLTINNAEVPTSVGDPTKPVVLDGFRIRWGRDRILDQPEPATGSLSLWFADPSRAAAWAAADGLPGQLLKLSWEGVLPGDDEVTREAFFSGRISSVKLRSHSVRGPFGITGGAIAEVTLSSVLNDLANITPRAAWPEEAITARLARIDSYAAPYVDVTVRDYWNDAHVEPVAKDSQSSILDHLYALFDSSGADRLTYLPDTGDVEPVLRRRYDGLRGLVHLHADPAGVTGPGRAGKGAYLRTMAVYPTSGTSALTNVPNYLDAAALEYDPAGDGFTLGPDQRITRVEVTYPDADAATAYESTTITEIVPGINETTHGIRAATITSSIVWTSWVEVAAGTLRDMVAGEGQQFALAPIVWTTRKSGGFETVDQVRLLLAGAERQDLFFLARSVLPVFGIRPVFGAMGGEIGYSDGGWDIALTLAPVKPPTVAQHAISWEEIGDDLTWQDTGDHPAGMHESVTYEDLRYCAMGLGETVIPADSGWDAL